MKSMGIGVAGCGASVWMHGPALARVEGAQVVAWMDPVREQAEREAALYGGEVLTDYEGHASAPGGRSGERRLSICRAAPSHHTSTASGV